MGSGRRRLTARLVAGATLGACAASWAQQTPAPASQPFIELPESVLAELRTVQDFTVRIDQPGYYAVLEYVRSAPHDPGQIGGAIVAPDWRTLVERPSEFRGAAVSIEGVVGANRSFSYVDPELRRRFGTIWQLELRHPERGHPIACTLVLTRDASEIGVGWTVGVTGYFVMARQYPRKDRTLEQAILLVAKAPTIIARAAPPAPAKAAARSWVWVGVAVLAAGAFVWLIVRGSVRRERTDLHTLSAAHRAPVNLAEDLERWADADETLKP